MPPRTIVIIRHGERLDHVDPSWYGSPQGTRCHDAPLTQTGVEAAHCAGDYIACVLTQQLLKDEKEKLQKQQQQNSTNVPATPQTPASVALKHLLDDLVVLSSPLIRTVQTASSLCDGFEARVKNPPSSFLGALGEQKQQQQQQGEPEEKQPEEKESKNEKQIPIRVDESMCEPALWLSHNLKYKYGNSSLQHGHSPKPFKGQIFLTLDEMNKNISDRVQVNTKKEDMLGNIEVLYDEQTGLLRETEDPIVRYYNAARGLLEKSDPRFDDKIVVLTGHGDSVFQLRSALQMVAGKEKAKFDYVPIECPEYTALSILHRSHHDDCWRDLIPAWSTPHLTQVGPWSPTTSPATAAAHQKRF